MLLQKCQLAYTRISGTPALADVYGCMCTCMWRRQHRALLWSLITLTVEVFRQAKVSYSIMRFGRENYGSVKLVNHTAAYIEIANLLNTIKV